GPSGIGQDRGRRALVAQEVEEDASPAVLLRQSDGEAVGRGFGERGAEALRELADLRPFGDGLQWNDDVDPLAAGQQSEAVEPEPVELLASGRVLAVALEKAFAFAAAEQVQQPPLHVRQHDRRCDLVIKRGRADADVRFCVRRFGRPHHRLRNALAAPLAPKPRTAIGNANSERGSGMRLQSIFWLLEFLCCIAVAGNSGVPAYTNSRTAV